MAKMSFEGAIQYFCDLPDQQRLLFLDTLSNTHPSVSVTMLAADVAKKTNTDEQQVSELFRGLAPAIVYCAGSADLIASLVGYLIDIGGASAQGKDDIGAQLGQLLQAEIPISVTSKTQDILWGHGHVYKQSHILTQIRPVFLNDLAIKPQHAVIMHELRISYTEGEEDRNIHVSLDATRLAELQQVIERALVKERTVRKASQFEYLTNP